MRPVKFRIWYEHNKFMEYEGNYICQSTGECHHLHPWGDDEWRGLPRLVEHDDSIDGKMVLMQFTGLKDVNGVDIYEGDILRAYYSKNAEVFINDVYWTSTSSGFIFGGGSLNTVDIRHHHIMVVGNVFENLELMEGKLTHGDGYPNG